jgi:Flp pilus assembly protein TadG
VRPPTQEDAARNFRLLRIDRLAARFTRPEQGAVAVEFSLVILLLITIVLAIFELAMMMLAYATLDMATQVAGRQIRTGEFQTGAANSKTDFKSLVCSKMSWLSAQCASNAYVDVQVFRSFKALADNQSPGPMAFNPNTTFFTFGGPTDIVLVRSYFKWRLFTPFLDVPGHLPEAARHQYHGGPEHGDAQGHLELRPGSPENPDRRRFGLFRRPAGGEREHDPG